MSEVAPVAAASSAAAAASVNTEVAVRVLKDSMELQAEAMAKLLAAMGIGQNLDVTA